MSKDPPDISAGAPQILETTLRDGSYAIDFQFTATDTAVLGRALDALGFSLIEVGHGVGLNASNCGKGEAVETDEAYLAAAAESVREGSFGAFCIPGVARLEDLDMAAEHGMGFVRIGTNVTEVADSQPFIERARKHDMFVFANFMKSYAMDPAHWAETAKLSAGYGAQTIYLVDSAGGMLPQELDAYFEAAQAVSDVPLGFHGHNNLGMAMSHSLRAVERGAAVVDASLMGMGRSAGNAPTELLVAALTRAGYDVGIDLLDLLDVAERYVKPFMKGRGPLPMDVVCGYSLFHSSFMGIIRRYASRYRVDPRRLIVRLCEHDRVNAPPELVERLAMELDADHELAFSGRWNLDEYYGEEQS